MLRDLAFISDSPLGYNGKALFLLRSQHRFTSLYGHSFSHRIPTLWGVSPALVYLIVKTYSRLFPSFSEITFLLFYNYIISLFLSSLQMFCVEAI